MLGQGKERQESSGSLDARPCSADKLQALEPGRRQGCRRSLAVGLSR